MKQGSGIRGTACADLISIPLDKPLLRVIPRLSPVQICGSASSCHEFALFYPSHAAAPQQHDQGQARMITLLMQLKQRPSVSFGCRNI